MRVEILSPYRNEIFEGVSYLSFQSVTGVVGILPHHGNFSALLKENTTLRIEKQEGAVYRLLEGGIVWVFQGDVRFFVDGVKEVGGN